MLGLFQAGCINTRGLDQTDAGISSCGKKSGGKKEMAALVMS
jgi:hypothetical protein